MGNSSFKPAEPEVVAPESGAESPSDLSSSVPEFRTHVVARHPDYVRRGHADSDDDGAVTVVASLQERKSVPTVFRWEKGGKDVKVAGTFSRWEKIAMKER